MNETQQKTVELIKRYKSVVHQCPIRGHNHTLRFVRGTFDTELRSVWKCPTGAYRFLVVNDKRLEGKTTIIKRPRWGWRND